MDNSKKILDWFWNEHKRINQVSFEDGFCQCETESFINRSSDPDQMRAICLTGAFIDQVMSSDFKDIYPEFNKAFPYPKVHNCQTAGISHPRWFIHTLTNHYWVSENKRLDYNLTLNRATMESVAFILFEATFAFLDNIADVGSFSKAFKTSCQDELSSNLDLVPQKVMEEILIKFVA